MPEGIVRVTSAELARLGTLMVQIIGEAVDDGLHIDLMPVIGDSSVMNLGLCVRSLNISPIAAELVQRCIEAAGKQNGVQVDVTG
jgi:hypothetical protein